MAQKHDLCRAGDGTFVRNLGWKQTATGYTRPKFRLGRDESAAKVASLRLEQLWEQVTERWEREYERSPSVPNYKLQTDSRMVLEGGKWKTQSYLSLVSIGFRKPDIGQGEKVRAAWDELTLKIAEAVIKGESVVRVAYPASPGDKSSTDFKAMSDWLSTLQDDIKVIRVELLDVEAQKQFDEKQESEARQLIEAGRKLLHKKAGGETLHVAFEAFKKWIDSRVVNAEQKRTPWGGHQVRLVEFLQRNLPKCSLAELSAKEIEHHIDILRLRPLSQEGKQISASWAKSCIKQYKNFLKWLNRSEDFSWKRPSDLEFDQVRIPLTPQEKSITGRTAQVKTFTPDELKTLWEYANQFQRLLMLLGLNCGFGRAEIASLELDDLLLRKKHPNENDVGYPATDEDGWILRNRHKTGVYGEWKLWPETMKALEWWLKQRESIEVRPGVTTVLVTQKGQRYDTPTKGNHTNYQIPNRWYALTGKINDEQSGFRELSFKYLRKTAGNLIRRASDGEVAGVFLCHGNPVKSDELLDIYTNRDFAKVFKAIDDVGEKLRPLWAGVADPFPEVRKKGGTNIGRGKILRIQKLKKLGFRTDVIMKKLGVSRTTVWRWAQANLANEPECDQSAMTRVMPKPTDELSPPAPHSS